MPRQKNSPTQKVEVLAAAFLQITEVFREILISVEGSESHRVHELDLSVMAVCGQFDIEYERPGGPREAIDLVQPINSAEGK